MLHAVSIGALARLGEPLPTLVSEFADAGFGAISMDPQLMLDLGESARCDLAALVAERGLIVVLHGSFDTSIRDVAELAELLGPRLGNVTFDPVLGWTSAGLLHRTERMAPYLQQLDPVAKTHGFSYGVEDFPETLFALKMYRDDLSPLLESNRFGILIDIGHFNESVHKYGYFAGVSPEEHFAHLPLRLLEVHLNDNDGSGDQHLPLGLGNIDLRSVARGLERIGFDGFSTIEIEPQKGRDDPIADGKRQIIDSLSFWQRLLADLTSVAPHHGADRGDGRRILQPPR